MEEDNRYYKKAEKRVNDIKGFYVHLIVFVFINIFFVVLNLLTSPGRLWFYWPLLGWGVGVVAHGLSVFGYDVFMGKDWEEKKIKEYQNRYKRKEDMKSD